MVEKYIKSKLNQFLVKILLFLAIQMLGGYFTSVGAQHSEVILQTDYFDESDGLVGRDMRALIEDGSGLVWIATNEGVNYFDGYDFKFIKLPYQVQDLILDPNGNIWALPRRVIPSFNTDLVNGTYWIYSDIIKIIDTKSKLLLNLDNYLGADVKDWGKFCITKADGYLVLQTEKDVFVFSKNLSKTKINLEEDSTNAVYIPASIDVNNFYKIKNDNISFYNVSGNQLWAKAYFKNQNIGIFKYFEIENGDLISQEFYSKNRLFKVNKTNAEGRIESIDKISLTVNDIAYFKSKFNPYEKLELDNGFILTRTYGILKIDTKDAKDIKILKGKGIDRYGDVVCIKDKFDNIWLGTHEGIYIFKFLTNPFKIILGEEQGYYSCRGIIKDANDRLIVNTYNGLALLDNDKNRTLIELDKNFKKGIDLVKIDDFSFFSGSHANGYKIVEAMNHPKAHLNIKPYNNDLTYRVEQILLNLGGSEYLVSSYHKILKLDLNSDKYTEIDFGPPRLNGKLKYHFHAEKHPEGIWLCGSYGLNLLDFKDGELQVKQKFFIGEEIRYFYKDESNIFWLATSNSGLIKWDKAKNEIEKFSIAQGFSNKTAHVIYPDEYGNLWIPTNNGLNKFNKHLKKTNTFYKRDGLSNSEFNHTSHYRDAKGNFYFGTISGIVAFHPRDFQAPLKKQNPLKINLTSIRKLNKNGRYENYFPIFEKNGKINIYPQNSIYALSFSIGDLFAARNSFFDSRLYGLEDEWTSSKNHEYKLGGLPTGDYEFQIKGRGAKSQVTENTIKIPIIVHAHVYEKAWFIFLMLSLFAFAVWSIFKLRIKRLDNEKIRLQYLVAKRTKEIEIQKNELHEINKTKDRLFAIIAHDLRSPSLTLRGLTKKVNYLIRNKRYEELVNLGNYIEENLSGFEKLINNLLNWAVMQQKGLPIKKEVLDVRDIINEILSLYNVILETRQMEVVLDHGVHNTIFMDKNLTSTILRNLIDNAIKYSKDGGLIKISSYQEDKYHIIKVQDNGIGMSEEEINSIKDNSIASTFTKNAAKLGLQLSIQMTKLANGELEVQSVLGKGSIFTLKLPNQSQG